MVDGHRHDQYALSEFAASVSSTLTSHTGSTAAHGATGAVVGTTNTQTLTNKTLNGATLDAASTIGGVSGTTISGWGVWADWSPTVYQNGSSVSRTLRHARYAQIGKVVFCEAVIDVTGSGTAATEINVDLPVNHSSTYNTNSLSGAGTGRLIDSGVSEYAVIVILGGTSFNNRIRFRQTDVTTGSNMGFQLASGDYISFYLTYEAA